MLPLSSSGGKWTFCWNGQQCFQSTLKIFLLAVGRRGAFVFFPRGNGEFCSCWHRQLLLLFHSIFLERDLVRARRGGQKWDAAWQMAGHISKDIWKTLGKNFPLLSAMRRVQAVSLDCLLYWSQSREIYATEAQSSWRAVTQDFNWHGSGPACPQIGSISCLSSENRTSHVFCCCFSFLQRNWKWQSFSCNNF